MLKTQDNKIKLKIRDSITGKQLFKLIGKHILIYLLTCIVAAFTASLSLGIWHEEVYLIIFIFSLLAVIFTTLVPYIISIIIISVTRIYFSYKLYMAYIAMGIICSLVGAFLIKKFIVLLLNGAICGLLYYYIDKKLSFGNKKL